MAQRTLVSSARPIPDEVLEEANQVLASYTGASAELWHYTDSHCTLGLRVRRRDGSEQFFALLFIGNISLPIYWKMKNPAIRIKDEEDIVFSDEGVEIVCREFAIQDKYRM